VAAAPVYAGGAGREGGGGGWGKRTFVGHVANGWVSFLGGVEDGGRLRLGLVTNAPATTLG